MKIRNLSILQRQPVGGNLMFVIFLLNIEIFIKQLNKVKSLSIKPHRYGNERRLVTTQSIVIDISKFEPYYWLQAINKKTSKGNYKYLKYL